MNKDTCPNIIIGCDPSFAHFGLSVVDMINKEIRTYDVQTTLGKQSFYNIYERANEQVDKVVSTINYENTKNILDNNDVIIGMENALPHAFNATALTALDILLFQRFGEVKTALFNPTYLNFIMGKHTKRDSINLALGLLSIFERHNYKHIIQAAKKLTDGEAESFIYACRMLCRVQPENEISKEILELQPLFLEEKEKFGNEFIY